MHNYLSLLKIFITEKFSFQNRKRRKINSGLGAIIFFLVLMLLVSVFVNYGVLDAYKRNNIAEEYPVAVLGIACSLTFISALFRANSVLFSLKDHAFLTPLPLKKSTIVLVKLTTFYLEEMIFSLLVMVPSIVFYGMIDPTYIFSGIVCMLTVPLIMVLLSIVLGFIITLLLNRFTAMKIITTILYIAIFTAYIAIVFIISYDTNGTQMVSTFSYLYYIFPFLQWAYAAMINHQFIYLLILVALALVSSGLLIALYVLFYDKLYQALFVQEKKRLFKSSDIKAQKSYLSLIKKDLFAIVDNPMLIIAFLVGNIIAIIIPISIYFSSKSMEINSEELILFNQIMTLILPGLIGMMCALSNYTCFSITLENNRLWIVKSLPIKSFDYFGMKLIINQLPGFIFGIASGVISIVLFKFDVLSAISIIVIPQLYILLAGIFGLLINLKFPKLNWSTYNEIKNSPSAMIFSFSSIIAAIILTAIYFVLGLFINVIAAFSITLVLLIAGIIALFIILSKKGKTLLLQIEC